MVVEWAVILLFILIGLMFVKFEHHTKTIKVVLIILIGFMLYFSVIGFFASEKIDLTSPRGVVNAMYVYFGWIGHTTVALWDIGKNTAHMVGDAIKVDKGNEKKGEKK